MKLASYRDGSRDGQLIVVSRDLALAHYASGIAGRLQQVLDDWNFLSPQLEELSQTLHHGKARHAFAFDPSKCLAPLPRAFQHAVADVHDGLHTSPLGAQWPGDALLAAHDAIAVEAGEPTTWLAGLAAVTGDLARGSAPEAALDGIRLWMLATGSASACAFGPVAATPDELGTAWQGGRAPLAWRATLNGRRIVLDDALADAGAAGQPAFGALIAALCRTRPVHAGSIVTRRAGPGTPLSPGDRWQIDLHGSEGGSVFGATLQHVVAGSGEPA